MTAITLLDGGIGQELIKRSPHAPTPLWSTQVMLERPELVREVHESFRDAGATVTTANTYAIHRDRLDGTGLEDRFDDLIETALSAADTVRDATRLAGSIGPLHASYRPDLHPPHAEAVALYGEIAQRMRGRVDLVICETVASVAHARAALEAALSSDVPVWLAFTVDDTDGTILRSGEPVAQAARIAAQGGASAVLANCSAPEAMPAALDALACTDLPRGAYANAFTRITKEFLKPKPTVDALQARRDMGPETYADHALSWIDGGATIVGGCCETGPAHIAEIARRLRSSV